MLELEQMLDVCILKEPLFPYSASLAEHKLEQEQEKEKESESTGIVKSASSDSSNNKSKNKSKKKEGEGGGEEKKRGIGKLSRMVSSSFNLSFMYNSQVSLLLVACCFLFAVRFC